MLSSSAIEMIYMYYHGMRHGAAPGGNAIVYNITYMVACRPQYAGTYASEIAVSLKRCYIAGRDGLIQYNKE